MSESPIIWIDVTDMVDWSGPPTGIQRVVFEYATRLAGRFTATTRFVAYDAAPLAAGDCESNRPPPPPSCDA